MTAVPKPLTDSKAHDAARGIDDIAPALYERDDAFLPLRDGGNFDAAEDLRQKSITAWMSASTGA